MRGIRNILLIVGVVLVTGALFWAFTCTRPGRLTDAESQAKEVILAWNKLYLELDRVTDGYYAPVSARNFAYISLTAAVASKAYYKDTFIENDSFHGLQIPQYSEILDYNLVDLLNSSYAESFRRFFQYAPQNSFAKINELEDKLSQMQNSTEELLVKRINSRKYGLMVANAVYLWSATDSYGHEVHKHLYDNNLTLIGRRNSWLIRTEPDTSQLLPYWGKVRPFLINVNTYKLGPPPAYSESPSSEMYKEALALYTLSKPLSEENRWIAEFWNDDIRGLTFSPVARWLSIAGQVVEEEQISTETILKLYLELGISLCDVSIIVWKAKYEFAQKSPQTYINKLIDKAWRPIYENPNFPTYPSGHAAFGAASSLVLSKYFGEKYSMTDDSHIDRKEFNGKPRSYNSFREMALENAYSRTAAGFQSRSSAEEGLKIGSVVAARILDIPIFKDKTSKKNH